MRFVVLMIGVLSCSFSAELSAQDAKASVSDITQSLKDTEAEIRTLSVTSSFDILHRYMPGEDYQEIQLTAKEEVAVDSEGRCRVKADTESFRKLNGGIEKTPQLSIGVFDGQAARSMTGKTRMAHGIVSSSRSDLEFRLDPRNVTTHYFFKPVSSMLEKRGADIVEETMWDGRPVIVIETKPHEGEDRRKSRFYVDPDRNFTVVRRAVAVQYPPHERWMEYTRIEGFDHKEVYPGVWLPSRVVHESFDPTVEHAVNGSEPPLSWRWNVKLSHWKVNAELPPSTFALEFSPGVYVNDRVTGQSYQAR